MKLLVGKSCDFMDEIKIDLNYYSSFFFGDYCDLFNTDFLWFLLLDRDNTIIGAIKSKVSIHSTKDNKIQYLNYITIAPDYQNKGYSKILLEAFFKYHKNCHVIISPFTPMGQLKIKHQLRPLINKYNVFCSIEVPIQ